MKKKVSTALLSLTFLFTACQQENSKPASDRVASLDSLSAKSATDYYSTTRTYSRPIPIDSANKMIQSYLTSIDTDVNEDEIRSLIFDADILRDYLNNIEYGQIDKVKFILSHKLEYINAGNGGLRPDSNSNALTLVIVGYGADGDYIYFDGEYALNICQPCPHECPTSGTAANDLLTQ